jgi:hypothetical protein
MRRLTLVTLIMAGLLAAPARAAASFVDVPDENVFAADITWLAAEGITRGCNPP